jgi:hypothetical protein
MAVVFSLDEIAPHVKKELLKELTFIPVDPYVEKMRKWGRAPTYVAPKIPVQMFSVNSETRTVRIPFNVAMGRMGCSPNMHKVFPKLWPTGPPKFHATLRDYQREVVEQALAQLKKNRSTTLGLPPSWGKTIAGAYLAGKANGVVMIFVHREIIGDAWYRTFELCYPQLVDYILYVGKKERNKEGIPGKNKKGIIIPRICVNNPQVSAPGGIEPVPCGECSECTRPDLFTPGIIICLDGRIEHIPQYVKDAVMTTVIDEAHLFCTPSRVECLLCTEPKFVIAETATLERQNGMESMIRSIVGREGIFKAPNKPYRVYKIKTNIRVATEQGARGLDFTKLTHELIANEERNRQIVDCILCNPHRKPMIMTRFKEHIPILKDLLEAEGLRVATLFGNQKSYSDSEVLIGTIPKMGVGFDEKNACPDFQGRASDLMLLVTSIADLNLFEQVKGRMMRSEDPVLFYFEDNIGVIKKHIKNTEEWIENTKGVLYEQVYEEGCMRVPDMDYSSGIGIEIERFPIKAVVEEKKENKVKIVIQKKE